MPRASSCGASPNGTCHAMAGRSTACSCPTAAADGKAIAVPEARVFSPRAHTAVGDRAAVRLLVHPSERADFIGVHEQASGSRIDRTARPRDSSHRAWKPQRELAPWRGVDAAALHLVEHPLALAPRLGRDLRQLLAGERPVRQRQACRKRLRRRCRFAGNVGGTGFSSMGYSGLPFVRSKTKISPIFVSCTRRERDPAAGGRPGWEARVDRSPRGRDARAESARRACPSPRRAPRSSC